MKVNEILKESGSMGPSDEKGIKKLWSEIFDAMFASSVMGLGIGNVTVKPNSDYVAVIFGDVHDEHMSGKITKKGNTVTMKIGRVFDEDVSHLNFDDASEAGETLTHLIDNRLF